MTNHEFKALVEALATHLLKVDARKPKASKGKVFKAAFDKPKASVQPKAVTWDVEAAAVAAALKAGFKATPRVDLLTAKGWAEQGFRPKAGTSAIRVKKPGSAGKGMPLFHKEQVEAVA